MQTLHSRHVNCLVHFNVLLVVTSAEEGGNVSLLLVGLSVCLSARLLKICGPIFVKFMGMRHRPGTNPNPGLATGSVFPLFQILRDNTF